MHQCSVRRNAGDVWNTLLDLALPNPCPGCGAAQPWCSTCAQTLGGRPRRLVGTALDADTVLPPAYALAPYRGPPRAAILAMKEHGRRDLALPLGAALAAGLLRLLRVAVVVAPLWLVPAPTRSAAARRRGGDPITRMARVAAQQLVGSRTVAGVAPCLYSLGRTRDSVGLDPDQRRSNLTGSVRWRARAGPPSAAAVVLLDDVVTSGSTAAAAARVLGEQGHRVQAVLALTAAPRWLRSLVGGG